jgi:hypothetical protein
MTAASVAAIGAAAAHSCRCSCCPRCDPCCWYRCCDGIGVQAPCALAMPETALRRLISSGPATEGVQAVLCEHDPSRGDGLTAALIMTGPELYERGLQHNRLQRSVAELRTEARGRESSADPAAFGAVILLLKWTAETRADQRCRHCSRVYCC